MQRRGKEAMADVTARIYARDPTVGTFINPGFFARGHKDRTQIVSRQHRLQVAIGRPETVHTVFQAKAPRLPVLLKLDRIAARKSSTALVGIGFQNERLQAALGQMQRGG